MTSLRDLYKAANPPYHNDALDSRVLAQMGLPDKSADNTGNALQNIAVAGALIDANGSLFRDDLDTLASAGQRLAEAGLPLHENARFHFYNLLPPVSSDFLRHAFPERLRSKEKPHHDVLIVCGVPGWTSRHADSTLDWLLPDQLQAFDSFAQIYNDRTSGFRNDRLLAVSRLQHDSNGVWDVAADNVGAKLVVTRGPTGMDAINSSHLDGDLYRTAIATHEKFSRVSGYVGGGLGFLASTKLDESFAANINRETQLGARLYDAIVNKRSFEAAGKTASTRPFRPASA